MRKKLQFVKGAFLALTLVTASSFAQTTILDYDYETAAHGTWTSQDPEVTTTIVADPTSGTNNVLHFTSTGNWKKSTLVLPTPTTADYVTTFTYRFYSSALVNTSTSQEWFDILGKNGDNDNFKISIVRVNSDVLKREIKIAGHPDIINTGATPSREAWHTMQIIIDPNGGTNAGTGKITFTIDGGDLLTEDNLDIDQLVIDTIVIGTMMGTNGTNHQDHYMDDLKITESATLSNNDVFNKEVSFSPNPAKNDLKIALKESANFNLSLYNIIGAQVLSADYVSKDAANVSISNLRAGVYLARITTSNGQVAVKKIVKN
ncbi:T9SS type A sorting domain-containing protein [Flavivirga eckloniae]|uniref:Secretion system C-terminal sorting domain-containing protein n=1 Tax=Flavivirga eckloniae TaxID=1803846 RepID=A0A2K9PN83_9FLAO|nr:T9SS type A sorting domain-containing protein [Flavivirga eckloniae]AUP78512.1 hypothetical protein C1H87_07230 [Flavivirga eckloniae]